MGKNRFAFVVPNNQDLDSTVLNIGLHTADALASIPDERVVKGYSRGRTPLNWLTRRVSKFSSSALHAMGAPRPIRDVCSAVFQHLAQGRRKRGRKLLKYLSRLFLGRCSKFVMLNLILLPHGE